MLCSLLLKYKKMSVVAYPPALIKSVCIKQTKSYGPGAGLCAVSFAVQKDAAAIPHALKPS